MKPEIRIALVKESERAKNILSNEYSKRWTRYGYLGATLTSMAGVFLLAKLILIIASNKNIIIGSLFLFFSLIYILAPWYFIIRREMNRKIQIMCEAILTVNESNDNAA